LERLDIEFSFEPSGVSPGPEDSDEEATDILCSKASTWDMPSLKYLTCSIHARDLLKNIYVPLKKVDFVFDRRKRDCGEILMVPAVVNVPEISFRVEANGSWRQEKGIALTGSQTPDQTGTPWIAHLPRLRTLHFVINSYNYIQGIDSLDAPSLERIHYKEFYTYTGYNTRSSTTVGWSMEKLASLVIRSPKLELIIFEVVARYMWSSTANYMEQRVRKAHDKLYSDWFGERFMQREGNGRQFYYRYTLTRNASASRLE
jgi:hypothetical protein